MNSLQKCKYTIDAIKKKMFLNVIDTFIKTKKNI